MGFRAASFGAPIQRVWPRPSSVSGATGGRTRPASRHLHRDLEAAVERQRLSDEATGRIAEEREQRAVLLTPLDRVVGGDDRACPQVRRDELQDGPRERRPDVEQEEVHRAFEPAKGLEDVALAEVDVAIEPGLAEMAPGDRDLAGLLLGAEDDAAAVVAHRRREVQGGDAERRPGLDDAPRPERPAQGVAELRLVGVERDQLVAPERAPLLELGARADHARAALFGEVIANVALLRPALRMQAVEQRPEREIVAKVGHDTQRSRPWHGICSSNGHRTTATRSRGPSP